MATAWVRRAKSFMASGRSLRNGWLTLAGILALYMGAIRPLEIERGVASRKSTGPGSVAEFETASRRHEARFVSQRIAERIGGIVGGVPHAPGNFVSAALSSAVGPESVRAQEDDERKTVRTASFDLVVRKPSEAIGKIRSLAENLGGFVVSSELNGGAYPRGNSTIRVPVLRFEEARIAIRELSTSVDSERVETQDVTRSYVDQDASLRNLRAQETQYLSILKLAHSVKDTLEVSEKLSDVRGQIERQQAEFDSLSKQIETVAISISLRAEADAQVFGLSWRPLYQLKLSLRDGLEAVASYIAAMVSLVFYLPAVLLWLLTILAGASAGWRILRFAVRLFFFWPRRTVVQNS